MNTRIYVLSDDEEEEVICLGVSEKNNKIKSGFCRKCGKYLIGVMTFPCFHAALCVNCYNEMEEPKKCYTCGATVTQGEVFILS